MISLDRLMVSGTGSGCGKTTVTCALLSAMIARGITPTAFKCGPDYIDPMFHRATSGIRAYNLDPFFLDGEGLRSHIATHAGALAVIEGAMGYYDGIAATDEASAFTVARETQTPVVLVISARGASGSLGAVIDGFARHRKDSRIQGVIFNDAKDGRYPDLARIAEDAGVRAYGYIPRKDEWSLPSRHLGLLTTGEITGVKELLSSLGRQAEQTIDIDGLIAMAGVAPDLQTPSTRMQQTTGSRTVSASLQDNRSCPDAYLKYTNSDCGEGADHAATMRKPVLLAVAKDDAFCFMYDENLEILQALGCELVFFSPMKDRALPENADGLYLCGGYPELHIAPLSDNTSMRLSISRAVAGGLPTIAESGGFLYLHDSLDGAPMCGVIRGRAFETKQPQRFGYITITSERDNMLCRAGGSIRSHEFHYWESSSRGEGFTARKAGRAVSYPCVHATDSLFAGFPHLFFPANPSFAESFIEKMREHE